MFKKLTSIFKKSNTSDFDVFQTNISNDIKMAYEENNPPYIDKIVGVSKIIYLTSPIGKLTYLAVVYINDNGSVLYESDIVNKKHSLLNSELLKKQKSSYDGIMLTSVYDYMYKMKGKK